MEINGATLAQWRRSRGWDMPEMARRLRREASSDDPLPAHDILVKQVRRWEKTMLRTERYELLYAKVLGIPLSELASGPPDDEDYASIVSVESPGVTELCAVLTGYGFGLDRHATGIPLQADGLERDLEISWTAYQQSRFTASATRVAALLADAQITLREHDAERVRILRVLALSHQLAASLLSKSGYPDIAWIAAERGLTAADSSGLPAVRCSLVRTVAYALHSAGHFESSMRLVEQAADSLRSEVTGDDTGLSAYGTLFLAGSMAAARFGDRPTVDGYLREAGETAIRLGRDANLLWTAFGPTNVAIHKVNTAVELGDVQTVLDHGLTLDTRRMPTERRARYLLDVARTHSLTGAHDEALHALLAAEKSAPEQARQHPISRKIIMTLMKNAKGTSSVQLGKLAGRAGLMPA